jgi:geranylgeranyl diphosphate synthase type II
MLQNNEKYIKYKELIDRHLLDYMPEIDQKSATLRESMEYSLSSGGKRIRSVMLLAACDAVGGDFMTAIPYACAIEYIHTYSLIHDDLPAMDDDELRRGKPTNHIVYGEAVAILAGDGLLSNAFEAMTKDMLLYLNSPDELNRRVRAAFTIAKGAGCRGMIGGQIADIEAETKTVAPELLDYIHLNKTAALFESTMQAGAYLGAASKEAIDLFTTYAEHIGLAFQIADDILDVLGLPEQTGKNIGQDDAQNKATYPALHGIEASNDKLRELTDIAAKLMRDQGEDYEFFAVIAEDMAHRTL